MPSTAPDFFLLAHSHGVSLLDALTDWRTTVRAGGQADPNYGAPFQGWFQGTIPRVPLAASVVKGVPSLKHIVAWVISSGSGIGPLVTHVTGTDAAIELRVNPEFDAVLESWHGAAPIVSMIHGNELARTLLNLWPPYDFLDSAVCAVQPGVPIIDENFIDEQLEPWITKVFFPLSVLKHLVPNPLAHILPPPPRENPHRSPHFEVLRDLIARHGFAPDPLRLKWYRRYCRRLAERLASIGCAVVYPPEQVRNQAGLLREDYAEGLSHGNEAYGVLIGREIESWLQKLSA